TPPNAASSTKAIGAKAIIPSTARDTVELILDAATNPGELPQDLRHSFTIDLDAELVHPDNVTE
ncbi:MAG: hypothetical protein AB7I30_15905, partial [Isosphaeraceae bacterium]